MNKIKVFHIIESGDFGGSGRMVKNICNSLDSSRFEITLVYNTRYPTEPQDFEATFNKNIRTIYLSEMVRSINLKKDVIAFCKLYRLFREKKPDVVHGHSSKAGFLTRIAGRLAGISKIFYSSHGYSFRMTDVSVISRGIFFLAEANPSSMISLAISPQYFTCP